MTWRDRQILVAKLSSIVGSLGGAIVLVGAALCGNEGFALGAIGLFLSGISADVWLIRKRQEWDAEDLSEFFGDAFDDN